MKKLLSLAIVLVIMVGLLVGCNENGYEPISEPDAEYCLNCGCDDAGDLPYGMQNMPIIEFSSTFIEGIEFGDGILNVVTRLAELDKEIIIPDMIKHNVDEGNAEIITIGGQPVLNRFAGASDVYFAVWTACGFAFAISQSSGGLRAMSIGQVDDYIPTFTTEAGLSMGDPFERIAEIYGELERTGGGANSPFIHNGEARLIIGYNGEGNGIVNGFTLRPLW